MDGLEQLRLDKTSGGAMYDIIIFCQMLNEGADVPSMSHMYLMGYPSNERLMTQLMGRLARDRRGIPGYSRWFAPEWVKESRVVFLQPSGVLPGNVVRMMLRIILASENHGKFCEFSGVASRLRINLEKKVEQAARGSARREKLEDLLQTLVHMEMQDGVDSAGEELDLLRSVQLNPSMTLGERSRLIQDSGDTQESSEDSIPVGAYPRCWRSG
jgi:hypothetical protein